MIRDLLKDIIAYLPALVIPGIIGFITIPIVTRIFSPADYGNYILVMATVMILSTLMGWLPISIVRFYPSYERDKKLDFLYKNVISFTFILISALSIISLIFLVSIKTHLSSKLYLLMYIGIGVFIVTGIFDVFQTFLRVKRQVNWYSIFAVWKSVGVLGIALLFIFLLKQGVESLLYGVIVSLGLILPFLWKKIEKGASTFYFKIDTFLIKEMAKYSFPLVMGNLAAWILSLSDRYILGVFRGAEAVGIYSASYNIADRSVMLVVMLFILASGPISMNIWEKEGENQSKNFLNILARYYLMICIPAVVCLSVLSKPIVTIMTGEYYQAGHSIIPFVAFGILIFGIQQVFQLGFLFYKKTIFITSAIIGAGLLNLLLNFIFIPKYGYIAAALTTLISYAFLLLFMIIGSRRIFVWNFPIKSLVNVTCASAIMGIVISFLHNLLSAATLIYLIVNVFLGGIIYFALLFLLQEFSPKEKEAIKQVINKHMRSTKF